MYETKPTSEERGKGKSFVVDLRVYEELNEFLPKPLRKKTIQVESNEPRSVKDLIESVGIPHTEVDLILANNESVSFDYLVDRPMRISVYPKFESFDITTVSRLGRPPLRDTHFIADVHLGKLVRILRLLGFDCTYNPEWDDEVLAVKSASENRVLLTRDRGLLKRAIVKHGIFIHSDNPEDQAREVVRRLNLQNTISPFSRCVRCNGKLHTIPKSVAEGRVPARTYKYIHKYLQCDSCGKIYWKGTHWDRLQNIVKRATSVEP